MRAIITKTKWKPASQTRNAASCAGCAFVDSDLDSMTLFVGTTSLVDSETSSNGKPNGGGILVREAGQVRSENVAFAYNGVDDSDLTGDQRYGVYLFAPETRLYTDDAVNLLDYSCGQKLPLAAAPEGPFLTGPPA